MRNKHAGIGSITITFWTTVFIVGILVLFALGSAAVNEISNTKGRVFILEGDDIGVGEVYSYIDENFIPLLKEKIGGDVFENG